MKPEKRLEILEAFASSKPTEFDGFVIEYLNAHPEQSEPAVEAIAEVAEEKPKRKRKETEESENV